VLRRRWNLFKSSEGELLLDYDDHPAMGPALGQVLRVEPEKISAIARHDRPLLVDGEGKVFEVWLAAHASFARANDIESPLLQFFADDDNLDVVVEVEPKCHQPGH